MNGYTRLDISVLEDPRWSGTAKGIYSVICSLRQNEGIENPTLDDIQLHSSDRKRVIQKGLQELRAIGLISDEVGHE